MSAALHLTGMFLSPTEDAPRTITVEQEAIVSTTVRNGLMVTMATVIASPIGPTNTRNHKNGPEG
jgi:hypothetical protein